MREYSEHAAEWMYHGIWKVLTDWFHVPKRAPTLPVNEGDFLLSFHPSRRYLSYLKLWFWIGLVAIDLAILVGWLVVTMINPVVGAILAIPAFLVAVVPDIIAYIAIHLKYDTMWYVMSDRSLRCRRGIVTILEHTITFENVQNVLVHQGPVQRLFGFSVITVETAGASEGEGENQYAVGNKALMHGIENPQEIRELIMERVRASRGAGLGDSVRAAKPSGWTSEHVDVLREIREAIV